MKTIDLTGQRYGRLLVVSDSGERYANNGLVKWNCVCDCGSAANVNGQSLRRGRTKSCGCLQLETVRLQEYEASFNKLYRGYVYGAKTRQHEFSLTKEEFLELTSENCFYCNSPPMSECKNNGKKSKFFGNYKYNGIDRIDNSKGYTKDNCVTSCFVCNQMKLTMGQDNFIEQCKRIASRH